MPEMNIFSLSEDDFEAIVRTAATEVGNDRYIASHPEEIAMMAEAVADTIINRTLHPGFPDTVSRVVNAPGQFSAINGPDGRHYEVYGSWQNVPDSRVNSFLREHLTEYLNSRARGMPSRLERAGVPGGVHFANPTPGISDPGPLRRWINPMIDSGAARFGVPGTTFTHVHGTDPNMRPLDFIPQIRVAGIEPGPPQFGPSMPPGHSQTIPQFADVPSPTVDAQVVTQAVPPQSQFAGVTSPTRAPSSWDALSDRISSYFPAGEPFPSPEIPSQTPQSAVASLSPAQHAAFSDMSASRAGAPVTPVERSPLADVLSPETRRASRIAEVFDTALSAPPVENPISQRIASVFDAIPDDIVTTTQPVRSPTDFQYANVRPQAPQAPSAPIPPGMAEQYAQVALQGQMGPEPIDLAPPQRQPMDISPPAEPRLPSPAEMLRAQLDQTYQPSTLSSVLDPDKISRMDRLTSRDSLFGLGGAAVGGMVAGPIGSYGGYHLGRTLGHRLGNQAVSTRARAGGAKPVSRFMPRARSLNLDNVSKHQGRSLGSFLSDMFSGISTMSPQDREQWESDNRERAERGQRERDRGDFTSITG